MSNPPDGLWIIDEKAKTLYANIAMAEILGTTIADMIGQSSFDYLYPEDVADAGKLFDSKQRGDSNPFQFRLRRKDGSAIWVNVQGTPMKNAAGDFLGIVGTFTIIPPR
jgi:PAS domain S-box-containing protein